MTTQIQQAPCTGCGGGSAGCSCDGNCACNTDCGDCHTGDLVRPRFFSGQLLTDADLQQLTEYMTAKNRLHNRYLHGSGVVCGLQVACHPCDPGKVILQPGMALDCCGNDIIVPCPHEVDILDKINDLRKEKRGEYDCGDPCERDCDEEPDHPDCAERKGRKYCLYLRYCEEPRDEIAPYLTNDDCGTLVCEPTRVAEGYKLELRCPEDDPVPPDVWSAMKCCIEDLPSADKAAEDGFAISSYGQQHAIADRVMRRRKAPDFSPDDRIMLDNALKEYSEALVGDDFSALKPDLDEGRVRIVSDKYLELGKAVVRFDLMGDESREKALENDAALGGDIEKARKMVQNSSSALGDQIAAKIKSPRDRLIGAEWVQQGPVWVDPDLDNDLRFSAQQIQFAYNAPYSPKIQQEFSNGLVRLRDWLIRRIEAKKLFADCKLRQDVYSIVIPRGREPNPGATLQAAYKLLEALLRYLIDCICAALNPPCTPCVDEAVKLACLEVDDCEVQRICNLERTYVLSGPAIRYWMPFLRCIGEFFERACCTPFRLEPPRPEPVDPPPADVAVIPEFMVMQGYMTQVAPTYQVLEGTPQLPTLFKIANVNEDVVRNAVNFGGNLTAATVMARDIETQGFAIAAPGMAGKIAEGAMQAMISQPNAKNLLVGDVQREVADLRIRVDEAETRDENIDDYVDDRINSKIGNLKSSVERRLTESMMKKTPAFKDLLSRLDRLENDQSESRGDRK